MKLRKKSLNISKKVQLIICGQLLLIALVLVNNYDLFGVIGDPLTAPGFLTPSSKVFSTIKNMSMDDGFLSPDKFDDEQLLYGLAPQSRQEYGAQTNTDVPVYLVYAGLDSGELLIHNDANVVNIKESQDIKDFLASIEARDISQLDNLANSFFSNELASSVEPGLYNFYLEETFPYPIQLSPPSYYFSFQSRIIFFQDVFGISLNTYMNIPDISIPDFTIVLPDYNSFSQNLPVLPSDLPVSYAWENNRYSSLIGNEHSVFDGFNQNEEGLVGKNFYIGYEKKAEFTLTSGYMKFYNSDALGDDISSEYIATYDDAEFVHLGGVNLTNLLVLGYIEALSGTYTLHDGQLFAEYEVIGKQGNGNFLQEGGSNSFNSLYLAYDRSSTGKYIMENGFAQGYNMTVGVDGIGEYTQQKGTMKIDYLMTVGQNLNSEGTVTVDGGSLSTQITRVGEYGTGTVNLNGGTYESEATTLGYGLSLSKDDFTTYISDSEMDSFWNELVANGYIEENGQVLNSLFLFDEQVFLDTLKLDDFTFDLDSVLDILRNNQHASSGTFIQTGGLNNTRHLILSPGKGSISEYNLNGGDLICEYIYLGYPADAKFIQTGGNTLVYNDLVLGLCDKDDQAVQVDNSNQLYGTTCEIFGGTFDVKNNILGLCGSSSLVIDEGSLRVGGSIIGVRDFFVGYDNNANYYQTTGNYEIGNVYIGYEQGSTGVYDMADGSLSTIFLTYDEHNIFGNVYVGYEGTGTLNIKRSTIKTNDLYIGHSVGSTGEININEASYVTNDYEVETENIFVGTNSSTGTINHLEGKVCSGTVDIGSDSEVGSGVYNLYASAMLETDYLNIYKTGKFNHYGDATIYRKAFIAQGAEYNFNAGSLTFQKTTYELEGTAYNVKSNLEIDGNFKQTGGTQIIYGDLRLNNGGEYTLDGGNIIVTGDASELWIEPDIYLDDKANMDKLKAELTSQADSLAGKPGKAVISGIFNHESGSLTTNNSIEINGTYELDGSLSINHAEYQGSFLKSNLDVKGEFEQHGVTLVVEGDLNVASRKKVYLHDGNITVTDEVENYTNITWVDRETGKRAESGAGNINMAGKFYHYGGELNAKNIIVAKNSACKYNISNGAVVNAEKFIVGNNSKGCLVILDDDSCSCSTVVVHDEFVFGKKSSCESKDGGSLTIQLHGAVFDILQDDSAELSGFNNINLQFFDVGNFLEAASEEVLLGDGFINNFAFNELILNAESSLTLQNEHNNNPYSYDGEAVFVSRLLLGKDSYLDLNGLNIYVSDEFADDGAFIDYNGGNIIVPSELSFNQINFKIRPPAVPEPSVYLSFFFGFFMLFSSLKNKYSGR